jgi:hypothetical protein
VFARLAAARKCEPGNLEVFYQMHTTRVKVLLAMSEATRTGAAGWA